jgi:carbonic anhydrase/acetyltransferase-like protein (isoleucine patch superfamily)
MTGMLIDTQPHPEQVHPSAFIAPGAVVLGQVTVGAEASLWFGVVARGDTEAIIIGPQSNVQDGCVLHADPNQPCLLGARVSLGHGAIVHGAVVEDDVIIGIRATVLNGARIGSGSIVAAGAVVTPGTVVPPGSMVMGVPGRVTRPTTDADLEHIRRTAEHYVGFARTYRLARQHAAPRLPATRELVAPPPVSGANPELLRLLRGLAVFDGLDDAKLARVAGICRLAEYRAGETITTQDSYESEMYIVREGLLEVSVGAAAHGALAPHTVVSLGEGQVVGEMALIDRGPRSATVRCVSPTCSLVVMERDAFEALAAADHHVGLIVYRNLAADLSFKLRHRHLTRG